MVKLFKTYDISSDILFPMSALIDKETQTLLDIVV